MSAATICDGCGRAQERDSLEEQAGLWYVVSFADGTVKQDACSRSCARGLFDTDGPYDQAELRMLAEDEEDDQ